LTSGVPRYRILRNMPSLNAFCRNKELPSLLLITSFNSLLACVGMRGSSCVVDWLIPDQSFLVPVGIVSGQSKTLQPSHSHTRNNCSRIARFAMHSWHGFLWDGVFLGECSPLSRSTSEWLVEARNIRDGIIPKAERGVLHEFPLWKRRLRESVLPLPGS